MTQSIGAGGGGGGGPEVVASGEVDVPDSTDVGNDVVTIMLDGLDKDGHYLAFGYPPDGAADAGNFVNGNAAAPYITVQMAYSLEDDSWFVRISADDHPAVTVAWTVYEL